MTQGAGQLLEIERIAATLVVQGGCDLAVDRVAEQLFGVAAAQGGKRDAGERLRSVRPLDLGREPFHPVVGAKGERDQNPRVRWPAEQPAEELDGRRVGPVEVVEDQDEWPRRREPLQQLTHRAMGAVALEREW